jgi:sugar (pentulose or hexulose) kinase
MDILTVNEQVKIEKLLGHGGLFKTEGVAQRLMASAFNIPVAVMSSAAEGGAWGIAILAQYMRLKQPAQSLPAYLNDVVFSDAKTSVAVPDAADRAGFEAYIKAYLTGLPAVEAAAGI